MKYTKLERIGDASVEQYLEGEFEEVLALFTEISNEAGPNETTKETETN